MESARAFAPGNISCIFVIKKAKNPATSGSLGMGFTVNEGVMVTVNKSANDKLSNKLISINSKKSNKKILIKKNSLNNKTLSNNQLKNVDILKNSIVYFNNKRISFPAVNYVIKELAKEPVEVRIKTPLPLGCGFGLSGASALASSYTLGKLFNLKKSKKELSFTAHMADVVSGTGLGDVINQYYGGFLVKYEPSYKFKAVRLPIRNKTVYCRHFSGISTKKILSNAKIKNKINNAGIKALRKIKMLSQNSNSKYQNIMLKNLINISKEFSINSNLLKNKKVAALIKKIEKNKGNASMIMLGNSVFSDTYFKGSRQMMISEKAAHLL